MAAELGGSAGRGYRAPRLPSAGSAQIAKSAPVRENYRLPHHLISRAGALFVMDDTRWDHGLTVTGEGKGLVGHAGAVLLRKLADQAGLTVALGSALARRGKFPLVDRGVALVSMAVAIVLGATSMADIAVLAHHAPVLGAEPSDTTVRRTLELADRGRRQAHRVAGQERAPGGAARRPGAGGTACPVPRGEDRAAVRGPLRPDRPLGPVPGRAGANAAGDGTARPGGQCPACRLGRGRRR